MAFNNRTGMLLRQSHPSHRFRVWLVAAVLLWTATGTAHGSEGVVTDPVLSAIRDVRPGSVEERATRLLDEANALPVVLGQPWHWPRYEVLTNEALLLLDTRQSNPDELLGAALVCASLGAIATDKQGRADRLVERVAVVHEEVLGETHPRFAAMLRLVGSVYRAKGDYDRALPLLQRSLDILKPIAPEPPRRAQDGRRGVYEVPRNSPRLKSPSIIVDVGAATTYLVDAATGFVEGYPSGVGRRLRNGHSKTPLGRFRTGSDPDDSYWYIPRRTSPTIYGGFPFIRITARNPTGANVYGLHGPIDPELEQGDVSNGCIRLRGEDIVRLYYAVQGHGSVPVTILDSSLDRSKR